MTEGKRNQKQEDSEVRTFTVPFPLGEIKENISIKTNAPSKPSKPSKEQIINQAFKFHSQGNITEAAKYYQYFINEGFKDYRVFSNLAGILKTYSKLEEAELLLRKAIEIKPGWADAYTNIGIILKDLGKLEEAELSLRKAIQLKPDFASAHSNLGNLLKDIGKMKEAELSTRKAIQLKPDFASAHSNLGIILKNLGKSKEAELSLRKAIDFKPDLAEAHSNLGNLLKDIGKVKEAELSTRKAIQLKPDFASAHSNLGIILKDLGKLKEAELSLRNALELNPDLAMAYYNLGVFFRHLGKPNEANIHFTFALTKEPNNILLLSNTKLKFSHVMSSDEQIDFEREKYKEELKIIKNTKDSFYKGEGLIHTDMFYLAYQNRRNDRIILEELSNTISNIKGIVNNNFEIDKKTYLNSKRKNIKVGVCSEYLRESHTIGKLYIKVLLDLLKTDIDIIIYSPPESEKNNEQDIIRKSFKKVIDLPHSPIEAQRIIYDEKLDILFYPDIGMSNYTYILALKRLALVQVNSLGHANTSGIQDMDYFITSDIEPKTSDNDYTEQLVRFSRLPFNYSIPKINKNNLTTNNIDSENYFNIGLTQSLFKIHPNYDEILESILIEIKNARLILLNDKFDHLTKIFKDRWRKRKNNLLLERSIFLNRMSSNDFINTTKSCHIMLDPFFFGSGNTFYESMAFGIPFITYPNNQKTKIASAGYKQMKVRNPPIAKSPQDYINWCKKYSQDNILLERTKIDMKEKAEQYLFNDNLIYKQYYKFFNESVKKAKEVNLFDAK